ncbi:MAG: acetolactate synthase small subunit [Mucinivorans sp.]
MKEYIITVYTENTVGVLNRITNIFTRRKINIESLTVGETHHKGISQMTIISFSDEATIAKVIKNIERIVEVIKASLTDVETDILSKSNFNK